MDRPRLRLRGPVLDAPLDGGVVLARFYERLLGWTLGEHAEGEEGTWAIVRSPDGLHKIEVLGLRDCRRPAWPNQAGEQQQMIHIDYATDDVEAAAAFAVECGATMAEFQPRAGQYVLLDPAGHPFCVFRGQV